MIAACAKLLRRDGRFVFSTVHPAFNGEATRVVEQSEDERGVVRTYSVKVSRYIRPSTQLGVALEGQPVVQWYFHCPLSELLQSWFRARFRPRRDRGTRIGPRRRARRIDVRCVHRSATDSRRADATGHSLRLPGLDSRLIGEELWASLVIQSTVLSATPGLAETMRFIEPGPRAAWSSGGSGIPPWHIGQTAGEAGTPGVAPVLEPLL